MKLIPLTQGKFAMVDDADFEAANAFKWYARKNCRRVYAARNIRKPDGSRATQFLHQFLMPSVERIDHKDGDGLNNQRCNLRPATRAQNGQGFRRKAVGSTSSYRRVSWDSDQKKWRAELTVNGKKIYLGRFVLEIDAAKAYDAAARKYNGDFASPNFAL